MIQYLIETVLMSLLLTYAPVSQAVDIAAVLKYERVVELTVPVSGVVSNVPVDEGQHVREGELLLELEDIPFKAKMDKTAAELRLLEAERLAMEKELKRNKELYERMVLSTVSLDGSELNFIRSDSLWQAKKADYELARYNYQKSRLIAPFAGKIIDRAVHPGQTVTAEMQPPVLFRLADVTSFIVEAEVSGEKIGLLAHGANLQVRIQGKLYNAVVKSSSLLAPARSLSQPARYRVTVKLDKNDAVLLPGQPATLVLSSQPE